MMWLEQLKPGQGWWGIWYGIPHCTLAVIPSLWGHIAGAAVTPEDGKFINDHVSAFMAEKPFQQPARDSNLRQRDIVHQTAVSGP